MTIVKDQYTVKGAVEYLKAEGYQVEKSKLYSAVKAGELKKVGRNIALPDLISYAKKYLERHTSSVGAMAEEKQRLEVEDLRGKVKERELKNRKEDRKWILREEAEADMAEKILLIYNSVMTRMQLDKVKILHAIGADEVRAPELVHVVQASVDRAFNELADAERFDVYVEGEED